MDTFDVIVIGAGLVGGATAYGLARAGQKVAVLDEGDLAVRPSRGNFGLVWVQGKGFRRPEYARWSMLSARLWNDLAPELRDLTGIDTGHENRGGFLLQINKQEYDDARALLNSIGDSLGEGQYDITFMNNNELASHLPGLGPEVYGGSYSPYDGHANPLFLLHALHAGFQAKGGRYFAEHPATAIAAAEGGYRVTTPKGVFAAAKVALTAGFGNSGLAGQVGLRVPLVPSHGQLLITERTAPFLEYPTNLVRQTREGTVMLGYTAGEFGFDTGTRVEFMRDIAWRTRKAFPLVGDLRVVRTWAALRTMTPDGFPVYEQSQSHPGVFVASCHSGVTLAAAHALRYATWVADGAIPEEMSCFRSGRFDVQTAA
ncbi:MAG: FAD-binding oxidoreductase [Hyphomicrobiales bacterium]|nr:FAD-binding oxidoreductase [Hyphomicrobiales bacterium]MCP5372427.1 FAD-binding oxidoreductase [Hyphomicrobiales bacterium]